MIMIMIMLRPGPFGEDEGELDLPANILASRAGEIIFSTLYSISSY